MASRSDSGNETRGSSESDHSPTPTKEIQNRGVSSFTPTKPQQRSHPPPPPPSHSTTIETPPLSNNHTSNAKFININNNINNNINRSQINTRTTPVSRTTPTNRPFPQHNNGTKIPTSHRLTPTAQTRGPVRPLQKRTPSSGMGSASSVHTVTPLGPLGPLGPLCSNRGRQRNSVAVVDCRDHIYEELEMCRGPPKLTPVSGVLPQGKVVIRPIAFKPVIPNGVGHPPSGNMGIQGGGPEGTMDNGHSTFGTLQGRPDPRYTSTPTLSRGAIQHYGSMGDLKSLGHSSSYSLDRRGVVVPNTRNYYDPYVETNNNINNNSNNINNNNNNNNNINNLNKYSPSTKMNGKYPHHGKTINSQQSDASNSPLSQHSSNPTSPNSSSHGSSSLSVGHSPPSYPMPPPRPPSHQSSCSNAEDGHPHSHHCYPSYESRLSSTYDGIPSFEHGPPSHTTSTYSSPHKYHSSTATTTDLPRYESLRNLSSTETHINIGHPRLTHTHHRMGGSVSNLTRLGHHHHLHHHHSGSISGSNLGLDRSLSVTGSNLGLDRSVPGSIRGSLSELRLDDHHQTPSPSDSGVAELEAMLKEKDSEINNLRETMEQNEQVIFKVYEEKEKTWERELKKIRDLYDSRLKAAQQKALKVEQSLSTQTYQLQQERRKVSAELEEVKRERDTGNKQVEQLKKEVSSLRTQLEETEWGLCQKSGEISLLKTQLKDSQGDQTTRGHELLHLRAQVRQYQQEVERRRAELSSMHDLSTQQRRETADLRSQLEKAHQTQNSDQDMAQILEQTRQDVEKQRKVFEEERSRWVEEKERVIRYQKQLHHNYVSMLSRNRQLEEEVARLTGVPLPPASSHNVNCAIPPNLPTFTSSCLPSVPGLPQTYSELREGTLTINSESRC